MNRRSLSPLAIVTMLCLGCADAPPFPEPQPASAANAAPASTAPMVVLLTKADWCSICKANGGRVTELLTKGVQDGAYELVVNDITNEDTMAKSSATIEEKGLAQVAVGAAPGTIAFVDPRTRARLAGATVAHQNDEITTLTGVAQKKLGSR